MDLNDCALFVAVADRGSVSKASEQLRITQPAVPAKSRIFRTSSASGCFSGRPPPGADSRGEWIACPCRFLTWPGPLPGRASASAAARTPGCWRVGATPQMIASVSWLPEGGSRVHILASRSSSGCAIEQLATLEDGKLHAAITVLQGAEAASSKPSAAPTSTSGVPSATERAFRRGGARRARTRQPAAPTPASAFVTRKLLDAVCRLERIVPNIFLESDSADTLLAMAEWTRCGRRPHFSATSRGRGWRFRPPSHRSKPRTWKWRFSGIGSGRSRYASFAATPTRRRALCCPSSQLQEQRR